ncbi:hypothetical protein [Volucribacter amazonae]|uniref:Metallo-beta-lactamase superfamily protein n=1 Tax=Volucribacter amazonae TaxID=256731 RepID=A0A9X4PBY9_9PAST|nr:hypothetical protein [Volucribacter amazonae]MDG6895462.1 hypothetical protein [Volucribacter amazonae]
MIKMEYTFWNVGQGLFSSGRIIDNNKEFIWVYDCGSTNQHHIIPSVKKMKDRYQNKVIDLLAISHFDKDHISGLSELLKGRTVRYLFMPYYPLEERLFIFFKNKVDKSLFEFYLNPFQYLQKHYGDSLTDSCTIILIPPSTSDENSDSGNFSTINFDEFDEFDKSDINTKNGLKYLDSDSIGENIKFTIVSLKKAIKFTYQGISFIPYNMPLQVVGIPANLEKLKQDIKNILSKYNNDISNALIDLKNLYKKRFTNKQNIISLFLYVLPDQGVFNKITLTNEVDITSNKYFCFLNRLRHYFGYCQCLNNYNGFALLYTGDGNLNKKEYFKLLEDYIGVDNIEKMFCLQVPHHGSRSNWYQGLANDIEAKIAVFSANPLGRYHHPHFEVLSDFLPCRTFTVDLYQNLTIKYQ